MTILLPMRFEQEALFVLVYTSSTVHVRTPTACIDFMAHSALKLATHNPVYHGQDRVMYDDPKVAPDLFRQFKSHLPETINPFQIIGLNERLRLYRYKQGLCLVPN